MAMPESGVELAVELPRAIRVPDGEDGELARREHAEHPHACRAPFARDCDRILHARAFRRLAGKTQVFTRLPGDPPGDHFRSRLTHTLEVTQIARTLAGALGVNRDLAEALALAHDIGHPPFGHAGEKALDRMMRACGLSFDHNLHALRIATWFEERSPAFRGLNLTLGVREGIIKHSRDYRAADHPELAQYFLDKRPPIEAQLIDLADEIAYLAADLDDGLDSGILSLDQVREGVPLFRGFHDKVVAEFPRAPRKLAIYETVRGMLDAFVNDLIREVHARVVASGAATLDEVRRATQRFSALGPQMEAERARTKVFLYENLYNSPGIEEVHAHATQVVEELFAAISNDPGLLPDDHRDQIPAEGLARTVADYIAGMTDSFIEQTWRRVAE